MLSDLQASRSKIAAQTPLHCRQPVTIAFPKALIAKHSALRFVDQAKPICSSTLGARMVFAVEDSSVNTGDRRQNLRPPTSGSSFDLINGRSRTISSIHNIY